MNKTIIININGIVFHIEEDAYDVLKNYMTDVKRHFMDSADSLEITTDIENRIAEMFTEILARESKQVIVDQDVRAVIAQMGTIEDFASVDEDGDPIPNTQAFQGRATGRRLFRDSEKHLLGGVCSGIANYFNIKAVWVRLLFVLITFAFFTGALIYLILWIVVPRAVSRADRMAMKGEPLDLQGFARNFEYELRSVQGTAAALNTTAQPLAYKTRDFVSDFFHHLAAFIRTAGKTIIKLIGIAIMLMSIGVLIALTIAVFTFFAFGNTNISHVFPFNTINHDYNVPFMIGGYLVLGLPLLAIALGMVRLVFNRYTMSRSSWLSALIIWVAAIMMVTYYTVAVFADMRASAKYSQTINIAPDSVYHLKINDVKYLSRLDSERLDLNKQFAGKIINDEGDGDMNALTNISLVIERADINQPQLVESFKARGKNEDDALKNTTNINYHFEQQGATLLFDRHMTLTQNKWRDPEVRLTLKLPLKTKVIIESKMNRLLDDVDVHECKADNNKKDAESATFVMTDTGLHCWIDSLGGVAPAINPVLKRDTINNEVQPEAPEHPAKHQKHKHH
ncbi:phage shock protein C (PspC) family protein [Mucilaginibacter yixingensis]|uniref:Phage shock protein C (PspC) family protein n=1 Tax=Mucilaginibacter yixingensis TaxID=1295612 RepID=A0A2T5JDD7_9SPHI|nr:PspC domain-containing protein [Mucilaginibacter yixingensis]PTQ99782.1 phage shock protein C (PspC) family protein [Mucilaginibacter yixingensis]